MIDLPQKDGTTYTIDKMMIDTWQRSSAYAHLNVQAEVEKMAQWLSANPKNRKVNTHSFVINWLSKAAENAPRTAHTAFRDRVQAAHREEMRKPAASPEVARRAIDEAFRILGVKKNAPN
jgi:hypothetical protein